MLSTLAKKSVMVIITYSPVGLGHLRVSDALYHGLPDSVTPVLLGAQDRTLSNLYRFFSVHHLARKLLEIFEEGAAGSFYAFCYRTLSRSQNQFLYQQISILLEERIEVPEVVVLVATHFGLAHQFAAIKSKLEQEKKVKVLLVVQVTDDYPHPIWYVPGSDTTFVPSEWTKQRLIEYGRRNRLMPVPFTVIPYPVSPELKEKLTPGHYEERKEQYDPNSLHNIHISIPVSGAAVNTNFSEQIINQLPTLSKRYIFHVITKNALYTKSFINRILPLSYVKITVSDHDRGVIATYENLYKQNIIAFEITKPSEQAFKALLHPNQIGGAIMLFSQPVGKQEENNLNFLRRHHLIPSSDDKKLLLHFAREDRTLRETNEGKNMLVHATFWRGLELPTDPTLAGKFIHYCLKNSLFQSMSTYKRHPESESFLKEVNDDGVELFWKHTEELLEELLSK